MEKSNLAFQKYFLGSGDNIAADSFVEKTDKKVNRQACFASFAILRKKRGWNISKILQPNSVGEMGPIS